MFASSKGLNLDKQYKFGMYITCDDTELVFRLPAALMFAA